MSDKSITAYLSGEKVQDSIKKALGDKTQSFIANVASLVSSNKNLQECDYTSVLQACLVSTTLELSVNPNLGLAAVIPYKDKTGKQYAQFQVMKKGYIQLALRTGEYKTINSGNVKAGEYKGKNRLTGEYNWNWVEDDQERDKLETVGYVAYFELKSGFIKTLYMTTEQLKKHGLKYSASYKRGYGNWQDEFEDMAEKTVLKLLLSRWGLLSTDLRKALEADQAILDEDGNSRYIDNEPTSPKQIAAEKETERVKKHIENAKTIEELEKCFSALNDETLDLYTIKKDELEAVKSQPQKQKLLVDKDPR